MYKRDNRVLSWSLCYFIIITIFLIELLGSAVITSIHFLSFILSFYFIGYVMINDLLKEGMFSIRLLFNAFGFLYTNFHIVKSLLNHHSLSDNELFAMELSYIAIITFNIAYALSKKTKTNVASTKIFNLGAMNLGLIIFFIISLLAEYYVVVYKIGLLYYIGASRSEQSLMRSDYSIFLFYQHTIPLISSVSLYLYLKYRHKTNLFLFITSCTIASISALLTASRSDMLAIALPILFLCYYFKIFSNKFIVLLAAGGFLLFGVWKSLFSDTIEMQYDSEFVSWYEICKNVLPTLTEHDFLYGQSYFNTIVNLIIPVTGTETLSVWYVKKFEFDVFSSGGGRGFSSVLEAFMNFHLIGVVIVYGFYGWIAKKINTRSDLSLFIYMIVIVSLNMLFRSEAYAFWKNMVWFRIYPILILYYYSHKTIKLSNSPKHVSASPTTNYNS